LNRAPETVKTTQVIFLTLLLFSGSVLPDVADIDDGAPETLDDEIRRSVTPPEYSDQQDEDQSQQQGQGPYIYNGYPYPFIYPYGPPIGNINPPVVPYRMRR
jgi:hypothetical protein